MDKSLEQRVAELEARLAPNPAREPKPERPSGQFVDQCGILRDARGRPVPKETPPPVHAELSNYHVMKAKFDRMTKGIYEEGTAMYEGELEAFIEADGNYRTRLWRDPFGRIRDRDGNAARVPTADDYDEADEIMNSMSRAARR